MIINDQEILEFIRKRYPGSENYEFSDQPISFEKDFIVVKDIHEICEDNLDITKDIYIRNLRENRQTNSINILNICDSVNAESNGLEEKIYQVLEQYNKSYSKAFLRNGVRWVELSAYNLACKTAKSLLGNQNLRTLFNICKYTYLLNNNILNTANLRLSLVNLRSCLELMHLEIRKMNYDMIMRPVTTRKGENYETLVKTKYVNNFTLNEDLHFDHEFGVFGTVAGLVARKNRGEFGTIKPRYYQFSLLEVLKKDYAYLNLDIQIKDEVHSPVIVNNRQIAHKVILKRKTVDSDFAKSSRLTGKLLARYKFCDRSDFYDYENPVELTALSPTELEQWLESGEGMLVYKIDETLFDSYSVYDTVNPQSGIVVEKGEYFDATHNLFGIVYSKKRDRWNLLGFFEHILLFSKTLQSDKLQRIKLYDSMMQQHQNATHRAEQAEKLVEEKEQSNEKIRELNITLQEKVKERTRQLELLNEQQRMNFINLVHETKTPLTLINNYLDEYIQSHSSNKELEIVKIALNKLTRDMNSLFDLERFNKGLGVYQHDKTTNFSACLKESIFLFEHHCKKRNIELQCNIEDDIFIKADPNSINRVINNLIENAVKFTPSGGFIEISLTTLDDNLVFKVSDTGKGIAATHRKKIFEPYYQISRETSAMQGMGLGLPIVKKVIDSLNGTILVENNSAAGSGTTFMVLLKRHKISSTDKIQKPEKSEPNFYNIDDSDFEEIPYRDNLPTILLVEDNKTMLRYLHKKLTEQYNIWYSENGAEAIRLLQDTSGIPDLIISDIMMDKVDGYELAKILSENPRFAHIPIIFVTAVSSKTEKLKGLKLGAIDWIQKPYSFEELSSKIETFLYKINMHQQALVKQGINQLLNPTSSPLQFRQSTTTIGENCRKLGLTPRETEIVELIYDARTQEQIADRLVVSKKTVSNHVSNIYEKLQVSSQTQLLLKVGNVS